MNISDSLLIENNKNPNEIILIKEGSWWRAYEESAYLCRIFSPYLDEKDRLKPTHRHYKDIDKDCIFVGFPINSLSKYLPNIENNISYSDDMNILTIDITQFSFLNTNNDWKQWKKSIPLKAKQSSNISTNSNFKNKNYTNNNEDRYMKLVILAQEIISYPIENKTMIDNINFISQMKQKFINII